MIRPTVPPFFPGPVTGRRDWSSFEGAGDLAERIAEVWRRLGHAVETRVEQGLARDGRHACYCVRSNLVGGLPAGRAR